jgi:dTMP kinase
MSVSRDLSIAVLLVAFTLILAAVGFVRQLWWLLGVGLVGLIFVAPISYKLVRFEPERRVSLGTFTRDARRQKRGIRSTGMLVCFSGIDGSGKSSTVDRVTEALESMAVDTSSVWGRWRPLVSYPVMGVLYVLRRWRRKDYDRSRFLRRFWAYFVLADLFVYSMVYLWPRLLRGEVVCVDRYIFDTVVELRYDGLYNERAVGLMRRLLPTPAVTFWLDVSPSVAAERKGDTQEMLTRLGIEADTETYLTDRQQLYESEYENFGANRIDTDLSFDETTAEITETVADAYFEF